MARSLAPAGESVSQQRRRRGRWRSSSRHGGSVAGCAAPVSPSSSDVARPVRDRRRVGRGGRGAAGVSSLRACDRVELRCGRVAGLAADVPAACRGGDAGARRPARGAPAAAARSFARAGGGRRVVLVTGASSGIGRATAFKIGLAGGIVLLVARSADKLEEARARSNGPAVWRMFTRATWRTRPTSTGWSTRCSSATAGSTCSSTTRGGRSVDRSSVRMNACTTTGGRWSSTTSVP